MSSIHRPFPVDPSSIPHPPRDARFPVDPSSIPPYRPYREFALYTITTPLLSEIRSFIPDEKNKLIAELSKEHNKYINTLRGKLLTDLSAHPMVSFIINTMDFPKQFSSAKKIKSLYHILKISSAFRSTLMFEDLLPSAKRALLDPVCEETFEDFFILSENANISSFILYLFLFSTDHTKKIESRLINGNTALTVLVLRKKWEGIEFLLKKLNKIQLDLLLSTSIENLDVDKFNALMSLKEKLDFGSQLEVVCSLENQSPISLDMANQLLFSDPSMDINVVFNGAVRNGHQGLVKLFLESKRPLDMTYNPNMGFAESRPKGFQGGLMWAIDRGYPEILKGIFNSTGEISKEMLEHALYRIIGFKNEVPEQPFTHPNNPDISRSIYRPPPEREILEELETLLKSEIERRYPTSLQNPFVERKYPEVEQKYPGIAPQNFFPVIPPTFRSHPPYDSMLRQSDFGNRAPDDKPFPPTPPS